MYRMKKIEDLFMKKGCFVIYREFLSTFLFTGVATNKPECRPLTDICNGEVNCASGDDEADCSLECGGILSVNPGESGVLEAPTYCSVRIKFAIILTRKRERVTLLKNLILLFKASTNRTNLD